tara:strand:- start:3650 stop:4189 length:540 start_codon:yes stop_codon:yes gene_type:complete
MKKMILLLFLLPVLSATSCNNDDDNNAQNPIDQLPQATQIGANTFGALLDGEPFIPSGGTNPLDCQYQLINGERYFQLQGNNRDENFNVIAISLSTIAKDIAQGETYNLIEEATGNASGAYSFNGDLFFTSEQNSGQLIITHLDLNEQIVSGTFWFDVIDQNGDLRQIRDGRFDMQFTQ